MLNKVLSTDQQALFTAIQKNDFDGAKSLIEKLEPEQLICSQDWFSQMPMHLALRMGELGDDLKIKDDSVAMQLIGKLNAEQLNLPDLNGATSLTYAFASGTKRCVEAIINKLTTEQLLAKQKGGQTYEELAQSHDRKEFAEIIAGVRLRNTVETSSVDELCKPDDIGNTMLHSVAKQKHTDFATLWLLLGKLPKKALFAQNNNHTTPFNAATMHQNSSAAHAIHTAYVFLQPHAEDMSLENVLGKELAKQLFEKLFNKPNVQPSQERS